MKQTERTYKVDGEEITQPVTKTSQYENDGCERLTTSVNAKFWMAGVDSPREMAQRARASARRMEALDKAGWEVTESRDGIVQMEKQESTSEN